MRAIASASQRTKFGEMPAFVLATRIQSACRSTGFLARRSNSGCAETSMASCSSTIAVAASSLRPLNLGDSPFTMSYSSLEVTRDHRAKRSLLHRLAHVAVDARRAGLLFVSLHRRRGDGDD